MNLPACSQCGERNEPREMFVTGSYDKKYFCTYEHQCVYWFNHGGWRKNTRIINKLRERGTLLEVYDECDEIGKAILSRFMYEDDFVHEIIYESSVEVSATEIFQYIYQQLSPNRRQQLAHLDYINVKLCQECLIPCDNDKCDDCVQSELPVKVDKGKHPMTLEPIPEEVVTNELIEEISFNPISTQSPQLEINEIHEKFNIIYQALNELSQQFNNYLKDVPVKQNDGYYAVKVYNDQDKGKLSEKAHPTDAGYDVYYTGKEAIRIPSHQVILVDIYIAIEIPVGVVCQVISHSSLTRQGINVKDGTIDSGYTGNISIIIQNDSEEDYIIESDQKIAQLVFLQLAPVDQLKPVSTREELGQSSRGTDGFGSTDQQEAYTYFLEQEQEEKVIEQ